MTSREELIEEAAKAVLAEAYEVGGDRREEWTRQRGVAIARAALDVFEKAHAPTNDERETLIQMLHHRRSQWHVYGSGQNAHLADEILSTLTRSGLNPTLDDYHPSKVEAMRAALHAAGEVR